MCVKGGEPRAGRVSARACTCSGMHAASSTASANVGAFCLPSTKTWSRVTSEGSQTMPNAKR